MERAAEEAKMTYEQQEWARVKGERQVQRDVES